MTDFALLHNDSALQVRKLAAQFGFHDPEHAGELAQLFDGAGRRLRYLRPSGVDLDAFGEILWDRTITGRRLSPDEVFELLSLAFDGQSTKLRRQSSPGGKSAILAEIDTKAARAKRNRLRKSVCPECGAIGYASAIVNLEHCGTSMLRVDPTFNEVMTQVSGASSPVPF